MTMSFPPMPSAFSTTVSAHPRDSVLVPVLSRGEEQHHSFSPRQFILTPALESTMTPAWAMFCIL